MMGDCGELPQYLMSPHLCLMSRLCPQGPHVGGDDINADLTDARKKMLRGLEQR